MFKVGDGSKTFAQLDWASAKAADVYGWAKAAGLSVDTTKAPEGQFVEGFVWENDKLVPKFRSFITEINETNKDKLDAPTTKAVKEYVDTEVQKAVSGGVEGLATEDYVDNAIDALSAEGGAIKVVADDLAAHEQAFAEFQTANTKAISDAVAAEAEIARAAEKVNADAITAIKDDADIDSFADVKAELAKKQDIIPANTYDAYGSAATAEQNAKDYVDGKFTDANLAQYTTEQEVKDIVDNVIAEAADSETYNSLTKLVDYIDTHGGEAADMAEAIEALEQKPGLDKVGTVTSITAGDGLDGGTITESGTIALSAATKASLAKADTALQDATAFDAAGSAAQALTDAKADTIAQIEALKLAETYEPIGAENRAKAYADGLASNYDTAGAANNALESAKAYTDELANGTVKTNSDKIAALEALDYILNGDTVILDCGGAE